MAKVRATEKRIAPIDMSTGDFRRMGYKLVDRLADFMDNIANCKVSIDKTPEQVRGILDAQREVPENGASPTELLTHATDLLLDNSLFNGHPRFWGYITSSPAPIGILGDMLASAINANLGGWQLSPMATEMEAQTVRWIAELLGYPSNCGGILVSGGNMANFLCFLAARVEAAKYNVQAKGLNENPNGPFRVYASKETHTWIQKATDLFGLGTDSIRWIKTDQKQRIDLSALREAVKNDRQNGDIPMMIVGTAGTVSTGAVDPLPELASYCRENKIWFHVDGAYGAFAALADDVDQAIHGLSEADSVAVDPHKWLYAPLEAGCSLVRDPEKLRRAFSYHPPYYHFGEEATNYVDFGMQNSRGFRALKVWLAIQQVGKSGYQRMISEDIRLTREMFRAVENTPELEALTCDLSIMTFRYVPVDLQEKDGDPETEEYLNSLNEELLVRLKRSGELFISNAVINDRFVLRACIVNFRTSQSDVEALPEITVRHGQALDRELRA